MGMLTKPEDDMAAPEETELKNKSVFKSMLQGADEEKKVVVEKPAAEENEDKAEEGSDKDGSDDDDDDSDSDEEAIMTKDKKIGQISL